LPVLRYRAMEFFESFKLLDKNKLVAIMYIISTESSSVYRIIWIQVLIYKEVFQSGYNTSNENFRTRL